MQGLASVIIPAYNNGQHIKSCIESVITQDYADVEIIVVDDGSTDSTLEQVRAYVSPKVTVVSQANQGPSGAINRGFDLAKGEFIFLHGGDDLSMPSRVRRQIQILAETGADLVACRPTLIDNAGHTLPVDAFPHFERKLTSCDTNVVLSDLFFGMNFICAPSIALKRSARVAIGQAHTGLIQLQDYEYWLRATALGHALHIDEEPLLAYRLHDNNLSRKPENLPQSEKEVVYVLLKCARHFSDATIVDLIQDPRAGFSVRDVENVPRSVILPFLYINHTYGSVRQIGYNMLLDLFGDKTSESLLAHHVGFTRQDFYRRLLAP